MGRGWPEKPATLEGREQCLARRRADWEAADAAAGRNLTLGDDLRETRTTSREERENRWTGKGGEFVASAQMSRGEYGDIVEQGLSVLSRMDGICRVDIW